MDAQLAQAWKTGEAPFSEVTLQLVEPAKLTELIVGLRAVVAVLRSTFPVAPLLRHDDWHEHDGYITPSIPTSWQWLEGILFSPEALFEARPGDEYVQVGVYPESFDFYLRIWVMEEDDDAPGRWGAFDLSGSRDLIADAQERLLAPPVVVSGASEFFTSRYAG